MIDEAKHLVDFSGDNEPELELPTWIDAQISEIQNQKISEVISNNLFTGSSANKNTQARWYQNYTVPDKYVNPNETKGPKTKIGDDISALEYVNWVKHNGQDCRPKLFDNITKSYILFDTGAMICCVPKQKDDKIDEQCTLRTADGKPMSTYGSRPLDIRLGRKTYSIDAKITDVKQPIVGMDFIAKYRLNFEWDDQDNLHIVDKRACTKQKLKFVTIAQHSLPVIKQTVSSSKANDQILFEMACIKKLEEISRENTGDITTSEKVLNSWLEKVPKNYQELIKKYDILQPNFKAKPKHNITHRIETGSNSPATCKVRPIPADKLDEVKRLLDEMESSGVIEKVGPNSNTNWSSALHVVRGKGKKPRVCVDYRILNSKITNDSYPLPLIRNISQKLHGSKFFSKIDLKKAYWNVPLYGPHKHKSTVVTPFGAYFFNRLPFGIASAPNSFQKGLESIFRDIPNLFIYMDDLLVYTETKEEHEKIVQQVLQKLHENGMAISLDKCVWEQQKVEYLGYLISEQGLCPLPKKVAAITRLPPPKKQKDLLGFLGAANFYRRNLKGLTNNGRFQNTAELIQCLYTIATEKESKIAKKFQEKWNSDPKYSKAFEDAKQLIKNSANLVHLNPKAPLALFVDASEVSVGGILRQMTGAGWQDVGFYSKSLNSAQKNYSTFRKELFALWMSIRHFLSEILGRKLTCFSDHRAIIDAFKRPELKQNDQIAARQMLEISQFTSDIRHISGVKNVTADFLSRCEQQPKNPITNEDIYQPFRPLIDDCPEVSKVTGAKTQIQTSIGLGQISVSELSETVKIQHVDLKELYLEQAKCPETKAALEGKHNKNLRFAKITFDEYSIVCEVTSAKPRPLVPKPLRNNYIQTLHSVGHPSIQETFYRVSSNYYWNKMRNQVTIYVKNCHQCLSVKANKQVKPHIGQFEVPESRFSHLIVDIVEMPVSNSGHKFCFTVICRTTRYFSAYAMTQATTENCMAGLLDFISHFGVPQKMSSDAGTQFLSSMWKKLETTLGIHLKTSAFYRPESQGMVEVSHRTFKIAIKAQILDFASKNQKLWPQLLPWALLSMRAAYRDDLKGSPSELAHGLKPLLPGSIVSAPEPSQHLQDLLINIKQKTTRKPVQTKINIPNTPTPEPPLDVTHVYTRQHKKQGLDPPYSGPYKIQKRLTRSTVRIIVGSYKNGDVRTEDRHWSDLKAIKLDPETKPEERPKLGRPPKITVNQNNINSPIPKNTINTGPPTQQPFTGFKPTEVPKKKDLFADCDWSKWKEAFQEVSKIDFSKPPPIIQPNSWTATSKQLESINKSIITRQVAYGL